MEQINYVKFLGLHITNDLTLTVKKKFLFTFLLKETRKSQTPQPLQEHIREHPLLLGHGVALLLHSRESKSLGMDSQDHTKDCGYQAPGFRHGSC